MLPLERGPTAPAAITGHWLARCTQVAEAGSGIADHLGDGAEEPEMLAARAGVDADALDRVLRYLVSAWPVRGRPGRLSPQRGVAAAPERSSAFAARLRPHDRLGLAVAVLRRARPCARRTPGETGMSHVFGKESFDWLAVHPAASAIFDEAMKSRASIDLAAVLRAYDFSRFGVIADIGGGNGSLLARRTGCGPGRSAACCSTCRMLRRASACRRCPRHHRARQLLRRSAALQPMPICSAASSATGATDRRSRS